VDGKGISPDNSSELAIHVVMVTFTVLLSLVAKLVATPPNPSLNLLVTNITYMDNDGYEGNIWSLTVSITQERGH